MIVRYCETGLRKYTRPAEIYPGLSRTLSRPEERPANFDFRESASRARPHGPGDFIIAREGREEFAGAN